MDGYKATQTTPDPFETVEFNEVPTEAQQLIWRVFFESRNRGVSLGYHFPWINSKENIACLCIRNKTSTTSTLVATTVVQHHNIKNIGKVGMIGLVCVDEDHRNKGLSIRLLKSAIEHARLNSLNALILWTSKPTLYEKVGFSTGNIDVYGPVHRPNCIEPSGEIGDTFPSDLQVSIEQKNLNGVPAFAEAVFEYRSQLASIIACKTKTGLTVINCNGRPSDIASIVERHFPCEWKLNTSQNSPIIQALIDRGYILDLQPSSVQMTMWLDTTRNELIPHIPISERI